MLEKGLCAEIKDAEQTVALTEEKCADMTQRIPEIMELEKAEKERVTDIVHIQIFSAIYRSTQIRVFLLLWQILQLKFQIDDEMQKNKKLKEKLIGLQEDIEKTVSIVTIVLKSLSNVDAALATYVCLDSWLGRVLRIQ